MAVSIYKSKYLYVFEDGAVGQRSRDPDLDDYLAVDDGLISVYRVSADGQFEELQGSTGNWHPVQWLAPDMEPK